MTKYASTDATIEPRDWHLYADAGEDENGEFVAVGYALCGRHGDGERVVEMHNEHIKLNSVDKWVNPSDYWRDGVAQNVCEDCSRTAAAGYLSDAEFLEAVRNNEWEAISAARREAGCT